MLQVKENLAFPHFLSCASTVRLALVSHHFLDLIQRAVMQHVRDLRDQLAEMARDHNNSNPAPTRIGRLYQRLSIREVSKAFYATIDHS